jgi:hypothetical protein
MIRDSIQESNHRAGFLDSDRIKTLDPRRRTALVDHFTILRSGNEVPDNSNSDVRRACALA